MLHQSPTFAKEIRTIHTAVRQLARAFGRVDSVLAQAGGANGFAQAGEDRPRRKLTLTTARRKALKLQGKYIGTIRGLKSSQKAKVKKVRAQKGIRAAIAEARRLAS